MATNYNNPWREKQERAERAQTVIKFFTAKFSDEIKRSARATSIYQNSNLMPLFNFQNTPGAKMPEIHIVQEETVAAAYQCEHGKTALLNFASYKNPGGMFIAGSIAQEESLCHKSDLYLVLSQERLVKQYYEENRHDLNRGLYRDKLLYSPDIVFINNREVRRFDVITCAAPNKGTAQRYNRVSDQECDDAMRSRIRHILLAAINEHVDTLVLGAFGCGVFRNDPRTVASIFKEELTGCPFRVVFAVPGDKYAIFREVLQ